MTSLFHLLVSLTLIFINSMIEITDNKTGEVYKFDPVNHRLFRDSVFLTKLTAEPVYSGSVDKEPKFVGIYFPATMSVLTMSGNMKKLTDFNKIK